MEVKDRMKFDDDIQNLLDTKWKDKDIYSMSLKELEDFKIEVNDYRNEYFMLEIGSKQLMNAAYGAAANRFFYFYNLPLAGDITGECRETTKFMNRTLEHFFHEDIWERKDLQEKFKFGLDESKHDWMRTQPIWRYSDTDSSYTTYQPLFECFDAESKERYATDEAKLHFILDFNEKFLDGQNFEWLNQIYNPRHGHNIHNFELETVCRSAIYLKKKKYIKKLVFNKGKILLDHPKVSGTGIEIIKSTTPKLCREILTELTRILMDEFNDYEDKSEFTLYFNEVLSDFRNKFYEAPIDDISQSVGVGEYSKYVIDDKDNLIFEKGAPLSVKGIARYNYLAHQHDEDDKIVVDGKIKYYRILEGKETLYFGFPSGKCPVWAPKINYLEQWQATVIDPINRFLEVMNIPLVNATGAIQYELTFD